MTTDTTEYKKLRDLFVRDGYVNLTGMISPELIRSFTSKTSNLLLKHGIQRNVPVEDTDNTKRKMVNVPCREIKQHFKELTNFYSSKELLEILCRITDDEVVPVPYEPEQMLITLQSAAGDTHGWHWGDYSYALILMLKSPPINAGGLLQCIPHTTWDKENPQIMRLLVDNKISSYYHPSGSSYLIKANTTLHRTTPMLNTGADRIIVRFGYAGKDEVSKDVDHSTMQVAFE